MSHPSLGPGIWSGNWIGTYHYRKSFLLRRLPPPARFAMEMVVDPAGRVAGEIRDLDEGGRTAGVEGRITGADLEFQKIYGAHLRLRQDGGFEVLPAASRKGSGGAAKGPRVHYRGRWDSDAEEFRGTWVIRMSFFWTAVGPVFGLRTTGWFELRRAESEGPTGELTEG